MAVSDLALVTIEEAKEAVKKTDDDDLGILEQVVDGVSALFSKFVGYELMEDDYDEELDGNGWPDLWLPFRNITDLTSVEEDGVSLTEDTDFYCYYAEGRLRRAMALEEESGQAVWTTKPKAIAVQATAGFTATTLPADIKAAALAQIAMTWQKFFTKSWGETTRSVAGQSITVSAGDLLPHVRTTLQKYRRIGI